MKKRVEGVILRLGRAAKQVISFMWKRSENVEQFMSLPSLDEFLQASCFGSAEHTRFINCDIASHVGSADSKYWTLGVFREVSLIA